VLLNKAVVKPPMFEWLLAAFATASVVFVLSARLMLPKLLVLVTSAGIGWLVPGLLLTTQYEHSAHHLGTTVFAMALWALTAVVFAVAMRPAWRANVALLAGVCWIGVNFALLVAYLVGFLEYEARVFSGLFANRNNFAMQTVCVSALLVTFCRMNVLTRTLLALATAQILFSLSISGLVGQTIVLGYGAWLRASLSGKAVVIAVLSTVLAGVYITDNPLGQRVQSFVHVFTAPELVRPNSSAFYRSWLYVEGVSLWRERPVIGHGLDTARFHLLPPTERFEEAEMGFNPHSTHLELLIGIGIVGYVAHYMPLLFALLLANKRSSYYPKLKRLLWLYFILGLTVITYLQVSMILIYLLCIHLSYLSRRDVSQLRLVPGAEPTGGKRIHGSERVASLGEY